MKISVVIPAYDTSHYLPEAMYSVMGQEYLRWDMIVIVDRADRSGCYEIATEIKSSSKQYKKIHVFQSKYEGCPTVTHEGILLAPHDVCTILDSDDALVPTSLSVIHKNMTWDVGFLWTMYQCMGNKSLGYSKPLPAEYTNLKSTIMNTGWWGAMHQRVFRKRFYMTTSGLSNRWLSAVDFQMMCLMASTGCKCRHVPEVTYMYRRNRTGSLSYSNREDQKRCEIEIRSAFRRGELGVKESPDCA